MFEPTCVSKLEKKGILVVSLYAHDLICTINNGTLIMGFTRGIKLEFTMTHLGKIKFFSSLEVT